MANNQFDRENRDGRNQNQGQNQNQNQGQSSGRGFASMDPERQREIASMGGQASGGNFRNDPGRAAEAGRKGGLNSHQSEHGRTSEMNDKMEDASSDQKSGRKSDES